MIIQKQAQLDRFDGKIAVLILENGQELRLLKDDFAGTAEIGETFLVTVAPESEAQLEKDELARTLLNQVLND